MEIPNYVEESHKPLWQPFVNWCSHNELKDELAIQAWWDCYLAGATCMFLLKQQGVY